MQPLLPHRPSPDAPADTSSQDRPARRHASEQPWWAWGAVVVVVAVAAALLLPRIPLHMWQDTTLADRPTTVFPVGMHATAATNALLVAAALVAAGTGHARLWLLSAAGTIPALLAVSQGAAITAAGQARAATQHAPDLGIVAQVWPTASHVVTAAGLLVAAGAVTVAVQQRLRWRDLRPDDLPTVKDRLASMAEKMEAVRRR